MRAALLALLLAPGAALAQYSGPAVETCRSYAKQELVKSRVRASDVVIERDQNLSIERYTKKLGSQFVSSVLTGNGAVVYDNAPSAELSFLCLLVDDKRAAFFQWLPRPDAPSLTQCTRSVALRAKPRPCLETLLQLAESDLTQSYGIRFQEARERDDAAKNESSVAAYRRANEEWKQYREAECARQRELAPQGVGAEDFQFACIVDLTRRRALDMR